jgi:hypothetical protein
MRAKTIDWSLHSEQRMVVVAAVAAAVKTTKITATTKTAIL